LSTIKDHLRELSVKVRVNGGHTGTGTILSSNKSTFLVTAAHVIFGKSFEHIQDITPGDVSAELDKDTTVYACEFFGSQNEWKKHDVIAIKLEMPSGITIPDVYISDMIEESGLRFIFRGTPNVTGNEFKFYEGFQFDDKNNDEEHRVSIHGDSKYLTDFNGIMGAELNAGVSGSGIFLETQTTPYMLGVVTSVPYENGAFGAFNASLIEPVRKYIEMDYCKIPQISNTVINRKWMTNTPIIYYEDKALKELLAEHEIEKKLDREYKDFSEELNKFFGKCIKKKMRNLDQKLEDGGRDYLIEYAMQAKEKVSMKILNLSFYRSAQEVYTYLLTNIRTAFLHQVQSKIKSGNFQNHEIDDIVKELIIDPYLHNLASSSLKITQDELYGILYFLTGNCYIEWD